jgi:hypothetical protein
MASRLSRGVLKEIVKECLVEILNEGISGNSSLQSSKNRPISESKRINPLLKNIQSKSSQLRASRSGQNSAKHSEDSDNVTENKSFNRNVTNTVNNLTSDPVLSSIFEDTARTTLQEQRSADSSSSKIVPHFAATMTQGDTAAKVAAQSDPMDIFAGSADKWASLAFSESANK